MPDASADSTRINEELLCRASKGHDQEHPKDRQSGRPRHICGCLITSIAPGDRELNGQTSFVAVPTSKR